MNAVQVMVRALAPGDQARWRELWDGYNAFYEARVPEDVTRETWQRILDPTFPLLGRCAVREGALCGIAHAVIHPSTWQVEPVCYLEDLFVDPRVRGTGAGRALIEDLLALCREGGWSALYWHTREGNATARRLYDRFAPADDFVRYRIPVAR